MDKTKQFCCYCGNPFGAGRSKTIEHLVPLSHGGNNSRHNKRNCCKSCNTFRGNKPLDVFLAEVKLRIENKRPRITQSLADLSAMVENIDYLLSYVNDNNEILKKPKRQAAMDTKVEVTCCADCIFKDYWKGWRCNHPDGRKLRAFDWDDWAEIRVHDDCPLKNGSITIKLKEETSNEQAH